MQRTQYQYQVLVTIPVYLAVGASDEQSAKDRAVAETVRLHPTVQPRDIETVTVYDHD